MPIPPCDPVVHAGTTFSVPRSSSETDRVSYSNSSLVNTPSSRMICAKLKIEVTKGPTHHDSKNGEHCYAENFIYEYPKKGYIKSNQNMGILHAFSNCVRAAFNHGLSPSEIDWGDPKGGPTEHGPSLMEVHWERKMLNYTSSGCMLMEV